LAPFYAISSDLKKLGFEIAVAISNVSNEFSLTFQLDAKKEIYKSVEEISLVLDVLNICFKKATYIEKNFWQAFSEYKEINIFNITLGTLTSVIDLSRNTKQLRFTEGEKFQALMMANDDRWRFFLPLDGIDSTLESIKMLMLIKDSQIDISNIEFVVGRLGMNQYCSIPILFLIKNSKIHLVISDYIDVMILINHSNSQRLTDLDFKKQFKGLLSIESLNVTFNQENANYTIEVFNKLSKEKKKKKILVENHPFKRIDMNLAWYNAVLNKIRLQIKSNSNNQIFDNLLLDGIPENIKEDLKRLLDEHKLFSALDLLKNQFLNDNFNLLKMEIEELYSDFDSIEETLSPLNIHEIEFIIKNRRFQLLFGNEVIDKLANMSKFKF
jgi:hypothetical protein